MSALKEQLRVSPDINLVYDLSEKPNLTQLKAAEDRAVVTKLRADLLLPNDKIMTVDIDFDTISGYHDNAIMIMDDFGVDLIAGAFDSKYGKQHGDSIRHAWANKQAASDPRKPTYLLVQKPKNDELPKVFASCGTKKHPPQKAPDSVL